MTIETDIPMQRLISLMQMAAVVNSSADLDLIVTEAVNAACSLTGAETGSLLLAASENDELHFYVALGQQEATLKQMRIPAGQGIAGHVFRENAPTIVRDVQADRRFYRGADNRTSFVTKSMVAVPLRFKGTAIGVLQVINKREGEFEQSDMLLVNAFGNLVAPAIQTARQYTELQQSYLATSRALAEAQEELRRSGISLPEA